MSVSSRPRSSTWCSLMSMPGLLAGPIIAGPQRGRYLTCAERARISGRIRMTTHYFPAGAKAMVTLGSMSDVETNGAGFFDMAMINEPHPGMTEGDHGSLVAVLSSQLARVRPVQESIDGHLCHIVDLIDG